MNPSQKGMSAYYKNIRFNSKSQTHSASHEADFLNLNSDPVQLPLGRQNDRSFQSVLKERLAKRD